MMSLPSSRSLSLNKEGGYIVLGGLTHRLLHDLSTMNSNYITQSIYAMVNCTILDVYNIRQLNNLSIHDDVISPEQEPEIRERPTCYPIAICSDIRYEYIYVVIPARTDTI